MNRAYSILTIKAFDKDQRIIEGIASTPSLDRVGDIVEPKGMEMGEHVPLLWQHNHAQPIGEVISAKVTDAGIYIKAKFAEVIEDGELKKFLDYAWQSVQAKLVRGLSIGFRSIESARIDGTYGMRFLKWELLELSAVTVPANADATITAIKSIDMHTLAALGKKGVPVVRIGGSLPGVSGVSSTHKTKEKHMNIQEQLKKFKESRQAKAARMAEIMEKAADENVTLDKEQTEEYDTLDAEVKAVDAHMKRLESLQSTSVSKAVTIKTEELEGNEEKSSNARNPNFPATVALKKELPKGIEFARFAMCVGAAKGNIPQALEIAKTRFADSPRIANTLKAAVAAGTTSDATWAAPLVEYNQFAGDFVEFLRPMTILGKFGQNGIPGLRAIPFNVHIRGQTSGGNGYWVGQGKPKPLTKFDFNDVYMPFTKVANIAVLTEELLRFSNPSAEALVRDALAGALIELMDETFVDPAAAAVANVSPASITNGVTPIPSSGNDAEAIRVDVAAAMATFITANISLSTGVWIMPASVALRLSLMRNALGQKEFPELTMLGGRFEGLPVIVSEYVPTVTDGAYVILASASDIWLADDSLVTVDASREASLEMLDNPTNDASDGNPATTMISMFQTNSIALRAERFVNWKKRRAAAVALISEVNWGEPTS